MSRITITTTPEEDERILEALTKRKALEEGATEEDIKQFLVDALIHLTEQEEHSAKLRLIAAQALPRIDPKHQEPVRGKDFDIPVVEKSLTVVEPVVPIQAKTKMQKFKDWWKS